MSEQPSASVPGQEPPEYHPAVERLMETQGDDAGRVKDAGLAHDLATSDGLVDAHARDAVVMDAIGHGDPDPYGAAGSYDQLKDVAHQAGLDREAHTFRAEHVPEPAEVSTAERTRLDEAKDKFILRSRGYMTDEQKDGLESVMFDGGDPPYLFTCNSS